MNFALLASWCYTYIKTNKQKSKHDSVFVGSNFLYVKCNVSSKVTGYIFIFIILINRTSYPMLRGSLYLTKYLDSHITDFLRGHYLKYLFWL